MRNCDGTSRVRFVCPSRGGCCLQFGVPRWSRRGNPTRTAPEEEEVGGSEDLRRPLDLPSAASGTACPRTPGGRPATTASDQVILPTSSLGCSGGSLKADPGLDTTVTSGVRAHPLLRQDLRTLDEPRQANEEPLVEHLGPSTGHSVVRATLWARPHHPVPVRRGRPDHAPHHWARGHRPGGGRLDRRVYEQSSDQERLRSTGVGR